MYQLPVQTLLRLAFVALVVVVFVACMIPIPDALTVFSWQDKVEHVASFLGLTMLGVCGWPQRASRVAIGLVAYGGLIELAQTLTSWRSGDVLDWLADGLGVLLGLALVKAFRRPRPV